MIRIKAIVSRHNTPGYKFKFLELAMIEVNEAFAMIKKSFATFVSANNFTFRYDRETMQSKDLPLEITDGAVTMYLDGETGTAAISYEKEKSQIKLFGSADKGVSVDVCKELSAWLFEPKSATESDVKSICNDFKDSVESAFSLKKATDLSKVKLPHSVSKSKAKSGVVSYDPQTLANRFVMIFPEYKDELKQSIVDYGEFLPLDFCDRVILPKFMDAVNGKLPPQTSKKLLKMICEIYEDGTNEVQDIIAVGIMSHMDNKEEYYKVVDPYMSDYMKPTIHSINKMMSGSSGKRYKSKMANPPKYKPPKKKKGLMQKLTQAQPGDPINK